uniref:Uncharacterized protein n=1 Tax=Oryza punctata TaxID=4537 RepID=A0A0E0M1M9_ORYPU
MEVTGGGVWAAGAKAATMDPTTSDINGSASATVGSGARRGRGGNRRRGCSDSALVAAAAGMQPCRWQREQRRRDRWWWRLTQRVEAWPTAWRPVQPGTGTGVTRGGRLGGIESRPVVWMCDWRWREIIAARGFEAGDSGWRRGRWRRGHRGTWGCKRREVQPASVGGWPAGLVSAAESMRWQRLAGGGALER